MLKIVKHGTMDVHRSSVKNTSFVSRGGCPLQSKRVKTISKPSVAWDHFTRNETSFQDEPMAFVIIVKLVTSVTLKLMRPLP